MQPVDLLQPCITLVLQLQQRLTLVEQQTKVQQLSFQRVEEQQKVEAQQLLILLVNTTNTTTTNTTNTTTTIILLIQQIII